jgi:hypothetical protein
MDRGSGNAIYAPLNLNLYAYAYNNPVRHSDPTGKIPIDTIWDAASIIYDVGKIGVGYATGNAAMVAEGSVDLACDTVSLAVPYVPAGATKLARITGKAVTKADDVGDTVKATAKAQDAAQAARKAPDPAPPAAASPPPAPPPAAPPPPKATAKKPPNAADWELRDPKGRIKTRGSEVSGGSKPGRRLSFPEQQMVHTEGKILKKTKGKTKPGDTITIRGREPPCPMCKPKMKKEAKKRGIRIEYKDAEGKKSKFR